MEVGVESEHEVLGFSVDLSNPFTACIDGSVIGCSLLVASAVFPFMNSLVSSHPSWLSPRSVLIDADSGVLILNSTNNWSTMVC
jgi:hypothetical protein